MLRVISQQEILIMASEGGAFNLAVANAFFLDGWKPERFPAFCSLYCFFSKAFYGFSGVDNTSDTHSRSPLLLWPTFNMPVLKDERGLVQAVVSCMRFQQALSHCCCPPVLAAPQPA